MAKPSLLLPQTSAHNCRPAGRQASKQTSRQGKSKNRQEASRRRGNQEASKQEKLAGRQGSGPTTTTLTWPTTNEPACGMSF